MRLPTFDSFYGVFQEMFVALFFGIIITFRCLVAPFMTALLFEALFPGVQYVGIVLLFFLMLVNAASLLKESPEWLWKKSFYENL